jgi:hypothetical protein
LKTDEKRVIKWVSTRNLYRDDFWYKLKACLKAFGIMALIMFVFLLAVFGFADGFSRKMFILPSEIAGGIFLLFAVLTLPSLFLLAWANGGVDEWEYEMDRRGIKGRKIVHKAWRMKVLRALAWITMLFPAKPGQKMAMRQLLYDNEKKEKSVDLIMLRDFTCDEKRGKIAIDTLNGTEEIYVPREDYAEVVAFIGERLQKKRPKRKPADGRLPSRA